ncbi:hypothetical protein NEOC84_001012|uniref:protease-like activity factor CPAF n=1 Tax=Neochlamydia sp. AcF84 TaxID=2315858 RepID=UPI001408EF6D|nr:protease-like activity factor CPAF [Neochlamydia sp. AcF84]NGY95102.1 hypothetical protein [Neochlamydia sp. AcF84]
MVKIINVLAFLIAPIYLITAQDCCHRQSQMIANLEAIKHEFEISYAPFEWKKKCLNWNLDQEVEKAKEKILSSPSLSNKHYHQIIRDLFNSVQDLHTRAEFYATEYAFLPFCVQGVQDHYFVVWVDNLWAKKEQINLQVGDEILSFDGRPVKEVVEEIRLSAFGASRNKTYQHLSEWQLTLRKAVRLQDVPQGPIEIVSRKPDSQQVHSFVVNWEYTPEEIKNNYSLSMPLNLDREDEDKPPFFHQEHILPFYASLADHSPCLADKAELLGAKINFFPALGPVLWKADSPIFDAYIYSLKNNKNIGYLRIPDFQGNAYQVGQFQQIITKMESCTDALIVDVMNNPGGFTFYMYALASMLTSKPLTNLKEHFSITQENVYYAVQDASSLKDIVNDHDATQVLGTHIHGYTVDRQLACYLFKYAKYIQDQFKQGKYFTDLYPVNGIKTIYPHPTTQYTKPLFVLTNSLSMSCAEFLPALLQGNERAIILGEQTAGAGGSIIRRKYSNRFGIADLVFTQSLVYHYNEQPLENVGVKPDLTCLWTAEDYTKEFAGFIDVVNEVVSLRVDGLLPNTANLLE